MKTNKNNIMKQTAVEFYHSEYKRILDIVTPEQVLKMEDALTQAKEMEKQQIINARVNGMCAGIDVGDNPIVENLMESHEKYYKETFNKEEPKQVSEQIIEDCGGKEEFMKSAGLLPKQETLLNPYIESFLFNNEFKKKEDNIYSNTKCIIKVLDGCYQINFNDSIYEEVVSYTDSWSIPHLVGELTWYDLIDKNYKK